MSLAQVIIPIALAVVACSSAPQGRPWEFGHVHIVSLNGGVLTAYPEEPADFPGHTYPIPGKVFVEDLINGPESGTQQWELAAWGGPGTLRFYSNQNTYNEVETYMASSQSFPMQIGWLPVEIGSGNNTYYITSRSFEGYCLNNDGVGRRIHFGLCDSAGSGSKWIIRPVSGSTRK